MDAKERKIIQVLTKSLSYVIPDYQRPYRGDVITLLQVTPDQAYKTLERMCQKMKLRRMGKGRKGSYYVPADTPGAMP